MTDDATPIPAAIDPSRVVWSAEPGERDGRPLVVLLHGYGSDARDLANVVRFLPREPLYASLCAPARCGSSPLGFEWFPLRFTPAGDVAVTGAPAEMALLAAGADAAARGVLAWLDEVAPPEADRPVALLGFSQGGIVALGALRREPTRFAGTVIVSSLAAPPVDPRADDAVRAARPRIWWGRGTADPVIPPLAVEYTSSWLATHAAATTAVEEGLGHEFSLAELEGIAAFLRERLGLDGADGANGANGAEAADA